MRTERWYSLPGFCALALLIEIGILVKVYLINPIFEQQKPHNREITITFQKDPVTPPLVKPVVTPPKPPAKIVKKFEPKPDPAPVHEKPKERVAARTVSKSEATTPDVSTPKLQKLITRTQPLAAGAAAPSIKTHTAAPDPKPTEMAFRPNSHEAAKADMKASSAASHANVSLSAETNDVAPTEVASAQRASGLPNIARSVMAGQVAASAASAPRSTGYSGAATPEVSTAAMSFGGGSRSAASASVARGPAGGGPRGFTSSSASALDQPDQVAGLTGAGAPGHAGSPSLIAKSAGGGSVAGGSPSSRIGTSGRKVASADINGTQGSFTSGSQGSTVRIATAKGGGGAPHAGAGSAIATNDDPSGPQSTGGSPGGNGTPAIIAKNVGAGDAAGGAPGSRAGKAGRQYASTDAPGAQGNFTNGNPGGGGAALARANNGGGSPRGKAGNAINTDGDPSGPQSTGGSPGGNGAPTLIAKNAGDGSVAGGSPGSRAGKGTRQVASAEGTGTKADYTGGNAGDGATLATTKGGSRHNTVNTLDSGGDGNPGPQNTDNGSPDGTGAITKLRNQTGTGEMLAGTPGKHPNGAGRGVNADQLNPDGEDYGKNKGNEQGTTALFKIPGNLSDLGKAIKRHGGGKVQIVYVLDTSASMNDAGKIRKAKQALTEAVQNLLPDDTFNIVTFDKDVHPFESDLVKATDENQKRALDYIKGIKAKGLTFLSGAMEVALGMKSAHQMYLMSDGEPEGGIEDFTKLCAFIKEHNDQQMEINTLALGTGEKFRGMKLLHDIAEQNGGTYVYINLATAK